MASELIPTPPVPLPTPATIPPPPPALRSAATRPAHRDTVAGADSHVGEGARPPRPTKPPIPTPGHCLQVRPLWWYVRSA